MNGYLTMIAQAATDPSQTSDAIEEIRSRLRLAGLLSDFDVPELVAPDERAVEEARKLAGQGTPLSKLVIENR